MGFEPNGNQAEKLQALEDAYNKCGWRTIIHKSTGVDSVTGTSKVVVGQLFDTMIDSYIVADTQGRDTSALKTHEINVIR